MAFIARAKQLGCSLEEITDLVDIWDGQRCGPVQRRFHELITAKIRDAETQVAELTAFTAQLRASAEQLSGEPVDGPCGPDCACLTVDTATTERSSRRWSRWAASPPRCRWRSRSPAPWSRARCRTGSPNGPASCRRTTRRTAIDGGLRIEFGPDVDLGDLGRLIGAEQHCCAFFQFTLTVDADGIVLEVRAPELAADMITDLFGTAA